MEETWAKLVYPGIPEDKNRFEVSTYGRIRNNKTGYIYKPSVLSTGYLSVRTTLGSRDDKINIIIHKAIAYTFLENQDGYSEVNHIDGDKENNHVDNLEWCSPSQNIIHAYRTGLKNAKSTSGESNANSKLSWENVNYIRENYVPFSREYGARSMSRQFCVHRTVIERILKGQAWVTSEVL